MTVREAMKTLEAQRILSVERGRGTFVNPLSRWASLEAVLRAASEGKNDAAAAIQLIELRRMLETGACELAAGRIGGRRPPGPRRAAGNDARWRTRTTIWPRSWRRTSPSTTSSCARRRMFLSPCCSPRCTGCWKSGGPRRPRCREIQAHAIGHHQNIADALASRATRTGPGTPWTPTCSRPWMT